MANFKKQRKYHFIYKITNLINGKFYYGMHSTNNMNDGYLGSGTRIRREVKKYGKENFELRIIAKYLTRSELVEAEKRIITHTLLKQEGCLNLKTGGNGGFHSIEASRKGGTLSGNLHAKRLKDDSEYSSKHSKRMKNFMLESYKQGLREYGAFYDWTGKKHTEETKEKMRESHKGKAEGSKNSQYGTCWITDGTKNMKIRRGDEITEGWYLGRYIKKGSNKRKLKK